LAAGTAATEASSMLRTAETGASSDDVKVAAGNVDNQTIELTSRPIFVHSGVTSSKPCMLLFSAYPFPLSHHITSEKL